MTRLNAVKAEQIINGFYSEADEDDDGINRF